MAFEETTIGPCRLIRADCLDVLPTLRGVDAVVTDPPYGTGWVRGGGRVGEFHASHERPDWDVWSTEWLTEANVDRWAVFCPLVKADEIQGARLYYHKTNARPGGPTREAIVVNPPPWSMSQWELSEYNGDCPLHPCQKPYNLIQRLVDGTTAIRETILDPFMGSGTTGVACVNLDRQFIGIEIDPTYYAIAVKRIRRAWQDKCSELPFEKPQVVERQRELVLEAV